MDDIIVNANKILNDYRKATSDVLLTPFKGNNKIGKRRRRLDFKKAKEIVEKAIEESGYVSLQGTLF